MNFHNRQDAILVGFVTLSLLLHFLLLNLLPGRELLSVPREKEPVYVEVRPPQVRELDLPDQREPEQPRETPAKRLGPTDRPVVKETAPKGDAPEDRMPARAAAPLPQAVPVPRKTPTEQGPAAPQEPLDPAKVDLNLSQKTLARVQQEMSRKQRPDVEEGEAVWLDTEKDILGSFFIRFRRNIYNVWNYPPMAAERGEKGICLLRITINRDGSVDEAKILETSGSDTLDREAVAAVYRGATYGELPSAYKGENLQFMAYFQYKLTTGNLQDRAIF
jgi:protein TonB